MTHEEKLALFGEHAHQFFYSWDDIIHASIKNGWLTMKLSNGIAHTPFPQIDGEQSMWKKGNEWYWIYTTDIAKINEVEKLGFPRQDVIMHSRAWGSEEEFKFSYSAAQDCSVRFRWRIVNMLHLFPYLKEHPHFKAIRLRKVHWADPTRYTRLGNYETCVAETGMCNYDALRAPLHKNYVPKFPIP